MSAHTSRRVPSRIRTPGRLARYMRRHQASLEHFLQSARPMQALFLGERAVVLQ